MRIIDEFKKKLAREKRFKEEDKILDNVEARDVEHKVDYINGRLVDANIWIDGESVKDSLEARSKYLDGASKAQRDKREKAVAKADKKGRPLSIAEVLKLRKKEEVERAKALKNILTLSDRGE